MSLRCMLLGHKPEIVSDTPSKDYPNRDRTVTIRCKHCISGWESETTGPFASAWRKIR